MSTVAAAGPVSNAGAAAGASATASARCDNCGAGVYGRYCGACGQRLEPAVHSLWHFTKLATEDLTHADSRLWRTLGALLFRPGYLTREFLNGRRARYLPPLRLYLVISVIFFLWASATQPVRVIEIKAPEHGAPAGTVTPLEDEALLGKPIPGESDEQRAERVCASHVNYDGPWQQRIQPAARRACARMLADNFRSLQEAFMHNLPRAMFLFLPILAGMMMLMYWRPRHFYVEHLLLFVHTHAFVFLLLMLAGVASALLAPLGGWISAAATLYIAWYAYRSMRVVYRQKRSLTLGKLALLSFFYLVSGSLMLALVSVYSAFTL
ncbi:MAG TPA: DUF3667 domain-containing protein [Steroidobacteraceae bacterium]|jgi:hypothetical protein|nr:DUF3667 domain-containing protein [Steroidobacteraceae bacterium]